MGTEFYVRFVGAYDGRDKETEERLVSVGFKRLKARGDADQFWLSGLYSAKGELAKSIKEKQGDKAQKAAALWWIQSNANAGQIAVVDEMWGAGPD